MDYKNREHIITTYFNCWINNNPAVLNAVFAKDTYYSESWGPEYTGLDQITRWFIDWNKTGKVVDWSIKSFWHQANTTITEWHFRAEYTNDKQPDDFDGVSIIKFDTSGKIISLQEFASKLPHYNPFEKIIKIPPML